ncbi:response regulator transcription factor [Pseudoflavitalea sp. X16]|uniref:response regulator transcription factor n=1 Tax=Paraflavitalea devenefica TaxID=2716334 RepID=UPI00141E2493|nr:response regulator transcription factor [Paraflavitalea devenefica]NII24907.1 response regulator transcription factor [Paraflavitalea devenefica]
MTVGKQIQVAVADDHTLMRKALARLISTFANYTILFEADNGSDVKDKISKHIIPDILLLDVSMPGMDGYETVKWLFKNHPHIKVLALSMSSDESTIIRMLRLGAKGYIMKNTEPEELKLALDSVMEKNFYLSEYISGKIISGLHKDIDQPDEPISLTEKEKEFLQWVCSELTYKDIAAKMFVSPRTVDDYRNSLFEKLKVKTRVGLVLYAIRHGMVEA